MQHAVTERETHVTDDGSWVGTITCSCGWASSIENYPDKGAAQIGLQAAWLWHADARPDLVP